MSAIGRFDPRQKRDAPHGRKPRLVNLLDDFALGGVSRALDIFYTPAVLAQVETRVEPMRPGERLAPVLDAEIIALHFPPSWKRLAYVASLRLRNPGARIVWIEHSYTAAWEALKVGSQGRFRTMLRLAYRLADQVVCVSEAQACWLGEVTGIDAARISVINPYTTNAGLADLAAPDFASDRPLRIGAFGRFSEQKGFDLLISAHRRGLMAGTVLEIGGFGPDEAMLRAIAGDSPDITFHGQVSDVAGFLAKCDVVAVPSRWEAFGMVANEAREAGRPIVVAPVDGLPEQVSNSRAAPTGLVVDFADDAAVAAGFGGLRDADLALMSANGRASTDACGSAREMRWAGLLREMLAPARRNVAPRDVAWPRTAVRWAAHEI